MGGGPEHFIHIILFQIHRFCKFLQAIDCSKAGMFNVPGCGVEKLLSVLSGGVTYLEILRFLRFGKNARRG